MGVHLQCFQRYIVHVVVKPSRFKKPKLLKETRKSKGKKNLAERAMKKATESFLKYQQAAEE